MRRKSHRQLGLYLADRYMSHVPNTHIRAFLLGCVEPDHNPATYLKGSLRCQWLRGHNYRNARRFLRRISRRLEAKDRWNLWDYYTLGKLIHYVADAFTLAHNDCFTLDLEAHRQYEAGLQKHFLQYLQQDPQVDPKTAASVMDTIYQYHDLYEQQEASIRTDARYALDACCCVAAMLLTKRII